MKLNQTPRGMQKSIGSQERAHKDYLDQCEGAHHMTDRGAMELK